MENPMNILVLAGGLSGERNVSLSSGTMIANTLRKAGENVFLVDVYLGVETLPGDLGELFTNKSELAVRPVDKTVPDLEALKAQRPQGGTGDLGKGVIELAKYADIVYMGLHGEDGENGRIQALFDLLGIKYTGSGYAASLLAMNKWVAKQILGNNGIPVAEGFLLKKGDAMPRSAKLPCVVKPCSGGSSIGVTIVREQEALSAAIDEAFCHEESIIVEEYFKGRELSVGVLDGRALPVIEIRPKVGFYDYSNKYQVGFAEEICPAPIDAATTEALMRSAEAVYGLLGLEVYARVDFILADDGRFICLEANTLPGMTPTSLLPQEAEAAGISYEQLCRRIVELSLKKFER